MQEAGISNKGLAARVRALAPPAHPVAADHVSVRRWLDGMHPRGRTGELIAQALSQKLARPVTLAEIGLRNPSSAAGDLSEESADYQEDVTSSIGVLDQVARGDLTDVSSGTDRAWVSASTPNVISSYLFGQLSLPDPAELATAQIAHRPTAIRITANQLMDLDFQLGGGHTRQLLLGYFRSDVLPLLRQAHARGQREVFAAAAEVAQLLGWSAYDAGRHGAAQRYFVQGLRLAREGNDHLLGGRLLANLSHQANYLGEFDDAVQYARAAQAATTGRSTPLVTTMFLCMEARALASRGLKRECASTLHRAEQLFERGRAGGEPDWIGYFNAEELAGESAHCFRDLGMPSEAISFATRAIEPTNTPPRTKAFIEMVSAAGSLAAGEVEEAVNRALVAVSSAGALRSQRYRRYVADFRRDLVSRYGTHPSTRSFIETLTASGA
jgi:tetratricopeptide (TPR) repeat protein